MNEQLALVISAAAADEPAVLDRGLERVGVPERAIALGLYIHVAVNEEGRCAGGLAPFGVHGGMAAGLVQLGFQADLFAQVARPAGGGGDVVLVFGLRGDARNAAQVEGPLAVLVALLAEIIGDVIHGLAPGCGRL